MAQCAAPSQRSLNSWARSVDVGDVSDIRCPPETRDLALSAALARDTGAVVAALAANGFRVPLPASFELAGHQALAVTGERSTMVDLVVPADRMAVVSAWERARCDGIAMGSVRALSDPERRLTITFIDARHSHGVWLVVLIDDTANADGVQGLEAGPLVVAARPRTATMHKTMTAVITAVDEKVTRMLGWTAQQMVGKRSTEFIHPDDHDRAVSAWMQLIGDGRVERVRFRHRCADGAWLWVEAENVHNGATDGDDVDVTTYLSDISDEMAAHEAVRRREQLFSRLAESLPTGVLQLAQDRTVVYANARLSAILGTGGTTASDVLGSVVEGHRAVVADAVDAAIDHARDSEAEVEVTRPPLGERRRCALTVVAVHDQEGRPGALVCVSDVTESASMREELRTMATFDGLTGCYNRASTMAALDQLLAGSEGEKVGAVFIDLDHFKPVNDRLGHAAGDELLVHVASRLRALTRGEDIVGRLGGDEFLLICRGSPDQDQLDGIAHRVRSELNGPVGLSAESVQVQASIGVTGWQAGDTARTLVARADAAMYESKRRGNGQPVMYTDHVGQIGGDCCGRTPGYLR